ncbi:MAG: 16S rRNA (cytidine(1402)-2'-O)-methyltransferase [Clostridiaceae bacterium]|nr:16S rRNA (cytidine(1402)-2'-O)-methyltransferase [Clostridiaceae bacterium]
MGQKGMLYLVATPIGNLEDITLRALRVLGEVDLIAAEDTRQTVKLLNHYGIKKPLTSYHEFNKESKGNYLVEQLLEGKSIALVSDAGTPGISDPGEDLVKLAIDNNIAITMVPGTVAAIIGLVVSGLSARRFVFEGFLPMNKRARKERMEYLKNEIRTIVLYEAPHKLLNTLRDLYNILGNRKVVCARELTKKFEEFLRCNLSEAIKHFEKESPRGEYVIVLEGIKEDFIKEETFKQWEKMDIKEHMEMYLLQGMDKKEAMKKVANDRGIPRREVYGKLLEAKENKG